MSLMGVSTHQWPKELKGAGMVLWKLPKNIIAGDHIIVSADEKALFLRDGRIYGLLEEGEHTLTSANIPWLGGLMESVTGRKFVGEVYYVWMKEFTDLKFGTTEPMVFRDSDFGLVRIRAFGSYSFQIVDPQIFLTKFVGTLNFTTADQLTGWMKGQLVRTLNDTLGELKKKGMGVVDFPAELDEMTGILLAKVKDDLTPYGIEIKRVGELNINLPEEVQKAIDQRSSVGALGLQDDNMKRAYMTMKTGEMMQGAGQGMAKGEGGAGMAAMGAGMGMGMMMPGMMQQNMQQNSQQPQKQCSKCGTLNPVSSKFCSGCGNSFVQATTTCPKCNAQLAPGAKFCLDCGNKI